MLGSSWRVADVLSRAPRSRAFWLLALLNILLLGLFIWSRGGSTTEIRIEVEGNRYTAYVDGRNEFIRNFRGPAAGGVGFALKQGRPPTLPGPHGIDWVRVTALESGEVLFEDDFDDALSDDWVDPMGAWSVSSGVLTSSEATPITTGPRDWSDYVLEARIRNFVGGSVLVRAANPGNGVRLSLDPGAGLRGQSFELLEDGVAVDELARDKFDLSRLETIRSTVAMLVQPYPAMLLLLGALTVLVLFVRVPQFERRSHALAQLVSDKAGTIAMALVVAATGLLSYVIYVYGQAVPHVPDSVAYMFQAKIFASFSLTAPPPPVDESFSFFSLLHVVDGRWFSQYPFGHPAFLAIGELFGVMWLVPPVLGAACVGLIYATGSRLHGAMVGVIAAALLFFSPFFQMTGGNFMSHNTACFVLLACLFFLTKPLKRPKASMFLAGIVFGVLFNIRPLTAVAFIPVLALFMGYEFVRAEIPRREMLAQYVAFAAGGAVLFVAYLLYNLATTGELLTSPYSLTGTYSSETVGFGGSHSVARGLFNQEILLALYLLVVNGWPSALGLGIAALPFVTGKSNRWDWLFAGSAVAMAGSYLLYVNAAALYGPRFWYETTPFLMLLTARGIVSLHETVTAGGDWLAHRLRPSSFSTASGTAGAAVALLIIGLVAFSSARWMFGVGDSWEGVSAVPASLSAMEGYNEADDRLGSRAGELDLENALVLVEPCPHWWCYGTVFWRNTPSLDGDVVWATSNLDPSDLALLDAYPARDLYIADYTNGAIRSNTADEIEERVGRAQAGLQEEQLANLIASRSDDIASHPATSDERDLQRRQDLELISAAFEDCFGPSGGYPDTGGQVEVLWTGSTRDEVCLLEAFLPDLPRDPLGDAERDGYWYLSDGTSFIIVALQETAISSSDDCPEKARPAIDPVERYCVASE